MIVAVTHILVNDKRVQYFDAKHVKRSNAIKGGRGVFPCHFLALYAIMILNLSKYMEQTKVGGQDNEDT